jgi:RHS repeat-associated protein
MGSGGRARLRATICRALVGLLAIAVLAVSTASVAAPPAGRDPDYRLDKRQEFVDAMERARGRLERQQDRRDTPEARAARDRSRHEFANASGERALDIARSSFEDELLTPPWEKLETRPNEKLRYTGRHSAVVEPEDEDAVRTVAESSVPLQAEDEDGKLAPVSLDLMPEEGGRALEAENPITPVEISTDVSEGARLEESGIGFAPAGAEQSDAQVIADKVFFANTARDTDSWLVPNAAGVQAFAQLRSEDSPTELVYRFELPEGARLEQPDNRFGSVAITRDDKPLGGVSGPRAYDADGQAVATRYEVSGNSLSLVVDHRGGDFLYPILVDPVVFEAADWAGLGPGIGLRGWAPNSPWGIWTGSGNGPAFGPGLHIMSGANAFYADGTWAAWDLVPYRSTISTYRADMWTGFSPAWSCQYYGIWANGSTGSSYTNSCNIAYSDLFRQVCWHSNCSPDNVPAGSRATEGIAFGGSGTRPASYNTLKRAVVYLSDNEAPSLSQVNGFGTRPWREQDSEFVTGTVTDPGIGIGNPPAWTFAWADMDGTLLNAGFEALPCDGTRFSPCQTSFSFSDLLGNEAWFYSKPTEGIQKQRLRVSDYVGHESVREVGEFRIDRSAPQVTLSGALKGAHGTRIDDRNYALHVDATDGSNASAATARSGVASIEIRVDGIRPSEDSGRKTQACPQSSCPMSFDWTFNSERYAAGPHTITAVVEDGAGHVTESKVEVTVVHSALSDIGPGAVALKTGSFSVSRSDAAVAAIGSGLAVSRTYNSRDLGASHKSPFGPGWAWSLPVDGPTGDWVRLDIVGNLGSDGIAEMTTAYGDKIAFKPLPGGTFQTPVGYEGLTLTQAGGGQGLVPNPNGYELKDPGGNVTVFKRETGGADTAYFPKAVRPPNSSPTATQSSFVYAEAFGGPRLARVIAPSPTGVDCLSAPLATRGCRSLTFVYATQTTSTSSTPGDLFGAVARIDFTAYDPAAGAMTTTTVAQYEYLNGRLAGAWDPRISPALKERYTYDSAGNLTSIMPPGEEPWTLVYAQATKQPSDSDYYDDPNAGRLKSVSRAALPGTATATVVYDVPVAGAGAPHQMGAGNVAAWGQSDPPVAATAIFPPDQVPGSPPSSYSHATIHYLDTLGQEVNTAAPGGRITTTGYDEHGNVTRQLSAANRERALAAGASSAARAQQLDTDRTYSADGTKLIDEVGPLHAVELASGVRVDARAHTTITYDEGAPGTGGPYNLPTTTTTSAQIAGTPDADARTAKTTYDWNLRLPTSSTVDPGGLNLTTTTLYDASTGQVTETRQPANPNGGDARATKLVYYAASSPDPQCANRPEWHGLVCKDKPGGQPATPGLPPLSETRYLEYNRLNQAIKAQETAGMSTRTTDITYDTAGRQQTTSITGPGDAVPTTTTGYSAATGRATTTTATASGGAKSTVTRQYDTLGRLTTYTDADGNATTTGYDINSRPIRIADPKGIQTYTYDPTTGDRTQIADSGVGILTATYNADGQLKTQTLPGGLQEQTTYGDDGAPTSIKYVKTTNCTSGCTWQESTGTETIHGQWATNSGTKSAQTYAYDNAGRLTEVRETPTGGTCTVRNYGYDRDSNRTQSVTHPSAADGTCAPNSTGTSKTYTYDPADRLTGTGVVYDDLGRITALPSKANADKGGLTLTYYTNDLTRSVKQGTTTKVFTLDPNLRQRTAQTIGGDAQTRTFHYADESDSPSWITESTDGLQWTRMVSGFGGDLIATQTEATTRLMLKNLHGDTVAEATMNATATGPTQTAESDEFGVPKTTTGNRFAYLGAHERRKEFTTSGVISMGVRTYVPGLGRFTAPDPIEGGSANDYDYANQDPVNQIDLDGRRSGYKSESIACAAKPTFDSFYKNREWHAIAGAYGVCAGNVDVKVTVRATVILRSGGKATDRVVGRQQALAFEPFTTRARRGYRIKWKVTFELRNTTLIWQEPFVFGSCSVGKPTRRILRCRGTTKWRY